MSCKVIMVTSFKGGVGKSTVAANFALRLAYGGKNTLLIDCDFRMRSLDILLGVEDSVVYDAADVLAGDIELDKAVMRYENNPYLLFLPAPFNCQDGIDEVRFSEMIEKAKSDYSLDYIILDTPGSSGQEIKAVSGVCDTAYIVATHSFPSIRAAECTGRELEALGVSDKKLIINMFDTSGVDADKKPTVVEIIDKTSIALIGIVPYDPAVSVMQDKGKLIDSVQERNIAKAFSNICRRTEGRSVPLLTGFRKINRRKLLDV